MPDRHGPEVLGRVRWAALELLGERAYVRVLNGIGRTAIRVAEWTGTEFSRLSTALYPVDPEALDPGDIVRSHEGAMRAGPVGRPATAMEQEDLDSVSRDRRVEALHRLATEGGPRG